MKTKQRLAVIFLVVVMALAVSSCSANDKKESGVSTTQSQNVSEENTKNDSTTNATKTEKVSTKKSKKTATTQKNSGVIDEVSTTSKRDLEDLPEDIKNDVNAPTSVSTTSQSQATTKKEKPTSTTKATTKRENSPYEAPAVPLN